MKQPNIIKILPLIIGVFLGAVSIVMNWVSPAIATYSGMRIIGNNIGYLLGALVVAYLTLPKWKISFLTSSLTIIIASLIYYGVIFVFEICGIGFNESIPDIIKSLMFWTGTGIICGALSATAMYFVRYGKTVLLSLGALITTYLGMLLVIYKYEIVKIINFKNNQYVVDNGYLTDYFEGHNFKADIFGVVFAVVLVTLFFVIALRKYKKQLNSEN